MNFLRPPRSGNALSMGYRDRDTFAPPLRKPSASEQAFFDQYPQIGGMASEDGKVVINEASRLTPAERDAIAINESVRLFLRNRNILPSFDITDKQREYFADFEKRGIPAERTDEDIRATLIGRIISGDPSAGKITRDQKLFADKIRGLIGLGGNAMMNQ